MIAQVKKQFEDLSGYLSRDVSGLGKLRKLKEAVNVLRTRLAAAEATEARAIELKDASIERSKAVERERDELRLEAHRLQQQVANLTVAIKGATAVEPEPEVVHEPLSPEKSDSEIKGVLKHLRKHMPYCPVMVERTHLPGKRDVFVFDRNSLATGWSHQSLWNLGASVALLAMMKDTTIAIRSEGGWRSASHDTDKEFDESYTRPLFQWISKNIDIHSNTIKAGPVRLTNCDKGRNLYHVSDKIG